MLNLVILGAALGQDDDGPATTMRLAMPEVA
jgi:hypothetical protein